jgi:tRNA (mo5U34)-methyltransferase
VNVDRLRREVDRLQWFHRIDLGCGVVTPGLDDTPAKIGSLGLPEVLQGKSVLDVGAWDGAMSFECERRGASRVLATDSYIWLGQGWSSKEPFDVAREALGSQIESMVVDVMDLDPEAIGTFDVVLMLGVLYHLRHPLAALERVASVTNPGGLLILETHVDLVDIDRPAIALYPGDELGRDGSNWCGPNPAAVAALLSMAGFVSAEAHSIVAADPPPDAGRRLLPRARRPWPRCGRRAGSSGRAVFHARR